MNAMKQDMDRLQELVVDAARQVGILTALADSNIVPDKLQQTLEQASGQFDPEISLIAILDADKEGFLRSETSLIQTIGRAARNVEGHVIMYADQITDSMQAAIDETNRRRSIQEKYNEEHHITPQSIKKAVRDLISISKVIAKEELRFEKDPESMNRKELEKLIAGVEKQMKKAAADLNFEAAAELRDKMVELKVKLKELEDDDRKKK